MDSNKDEAIKCFGIAKESIAAGDKQRALKFIKIAQRLYCNLSVDDLLAACEKMDAPVDKSEAKNEGSWNHTEENVKLIRKIKEKKDYYAVLGIEKTSTVEEIKKAYRKLSLKVHPDKNKAPGADEAFKKVCKAFKCLSDEESRRQYDQTTGLVDDFEYDQQHNVRRRRPRTGYGNGNGNDFFDDGFEPDVFNSFSFCRTRGMGTQQRTECNGVGPNLMVFLQLVPFLVILLLAYLPFLEPEYSLQRSNSYQFSRVTESYGVEYFVKTLDFDGSYPLGSAAREKFEENVIGGYKNYLGRYCHLELQRRHWNRNLATPYCDKLQSFRVA